MALVVDFTCPNCTLKRREARVTAGECNTCASARAVILERAHLDLLASLPVEERLRRIETALYQLDAETRLKALEARYQKYA
jgi:Zn-finger nucleic acid-binding protein